MSGQSKRRENDETLPNFIRKKKKHPRKGEKKKQGARTKVQASKQPNRGGPQGVKGTTKNRTLHQSRNTLVYMCRVRP
jgi:hypothetical protein